MIGRIACPVGPSDERSPPAVAGPRDERVTLFTFTVAEPQKAAAATARRKQLAEHVEELLGARIVAEHRERLGHKRGTLAVAGLARRR